MNESLSILIVEDNEDFSYVLTSFLSNNNEVMTANSISKAREFLRLRRYDLALLDINLPDGDGLTLMPEIRESHPDAAIWIMSANSDVSIAINAMKHGAEDYLVKPIQLEELSQLIEKLAINRTLRDELATLRSKVEQFQKTGFIAKSDKMQEILKTVRQFAKADRSTILITGETGTGKELIAEEIHISSPRNNGPFIKVNCSAIPENLLESELFGYEKGAFTDARNTKNGLFEKAHRGTLFLDEIGELSLTLQPKLLRALESKAIRRLGGHSELIVDVRLIAATNRNLREMVENNLFRADLYHRLNVLEVLVPPLRERHEDIIYIAHSFIALFARDFGVSTFLTPEAELVLSRYSWPGNVRELKNILERAVIVSNGQPIKPQHLSSFITSSTDEGPFVEKRSGKQIYFDEMVTLEEMSRVYIQKVLEYHRGNKTLAAKTLNISRNTLRDRLGN